MQALEAWRFSPGSELPCGFKNWKPKASGVWKVALQVKATCPVFIWLASADFGKASGRRLPCVVHASWRLCGSRWAPDIPKALAGAHMAHRCFECDVGFQCKSWSLRSTQEKLNICLKKKIFFKLRDSKTLCLWLPDCVLVLVSEPIEDFLPSTWERPNPSWVLLILILLLDHILFG